MTIDEIQYTAPKPDDWSDYRTLRLEALRTEPAAFSSTHEDALVRSDEDWRALLADPRRTVLIARTDDRFIGMVGLYRGTDDGDERVAIVTSLYVNGGYRRQGVGTRLLELLIDLVSDDPDIVTIRLWVSERQDAARRLYTAFGFNLVGRDKRQLQGDGQYHDELILERSVSQVRPGEGRAAGGLAAILPPMSKANRTTSSEEQGGD